MSIKTPYVLILIMTSCLFCCAVKDRIDQQNKAKANADYIMNNLNRDDIINQFPEKYFPKDQFQPFLMKLKQNCDFDSKKGKYVDFVTMRDGGNKSAFIYEYILRCDSLRFIYFYDMDAIQPELIKLRIEGLEQNNPMIIDSTKQLLYSK